MRLPILRTAFRDLVIVTMAAFPAAGCIFPPTGSCGDPVAGSAPLPADLEADGADDLARCRAEHTLEACRRFCETVIAEQGDSDHHVVACDLEEPPADSSSRPVLRYTTRPRCIGGRRPEGYDPSCVPDGVGGFLAEQARLEAASVTAFGALADALSAHGAPRALIARSRRAARDEVVHAALCDALARGRGVVPRYAFARTAEVPSLEALATDNAVEGCVRESWAALIATWQARAAGDPQIRAAMRRIAPDETEHATLSRSIDRWAARRLSGPARRRVAAARAAAIADIAATAAEAPPSPLVAELGLPVAAAAVRLCAGMRATVWA